jgi:hypothetical protein
MATNNPYNTGPLYSHGWDERDELYRAPESHYESSWGPTQNNFTRDDNRHRGGFPGRPGSNYASGSFGGAGQGMGMDNDPYRGYDHTGDGGGSFANVYNQAYGQDNYRQFGRPHEQQDEFHGNRYQPTYRQHNDFSSRERWERYDWEDRVAQGPSRGDSSHRTGNDGPYRGKGPKNYRRADSRIREDVSDRLSDDPYIDASDIDIKVEDGNVVLSGRVENRNAKRRAADLAESIRGVTNVENRLRTGQGVMENISHAVTAAIGDVTLGPEVSTVEQPKKGRKKKG